MLVLSVLRQNGFRRIEFLSLPNRAIIVQRMVQTRKFGGLGNFSSWPDLPKPPEPPEPLEPPAKKIKVSKSEANVSDETTFLKRADSLWKVGVHSSAAGGMENAVTNAVSIGANSFALFSKSPFQWKSTPLTPRTISEFKMRMKQYGYANNMVLVHGSYLITLGSTDREKREKSFESLLDDLQRCEALGLELYMFRPGSAAAAMPRESSLNWIADCINWVHKAIRTVTPVLENREGNVVGSKFSDLARIIDKVEDKKRVGVCLNTCSAFAAGYDMRTKEAWDATMREFDKEIGLNYLRGMHLSDSGTACGSMKERHQNIGLGNMGITTFQHIVQDPRTQNIPLILTTPGFKQPKVVWAKEMEVLQALTNTPPWIKSEEDLQSLVRVLEKAVEEAELNKMKQKELAKSKKITNSDGTVEGAEPRKRKRRVTSTKLTDSDVDNSAESRQTNEPEQWPLPSSTTKRPKRSGDLWQNYLR